MPDIRKDIVDYSDGFKDGYRISSGKAILWMKEIIEEVISELDYDENTRWDIISNVATKVKQTDFLAEQDSDLWDCIRSRG